MTRTPDRAGALLTATEVAEIFGIHRVSVYRWAKAGNLTPVRIGGIVRFRRDEVESVLAGETPGGKGAA